MCISHQHGTIPRFFFFFCQTWVEPLILQFGSFIDAFGKEEPGSGTILDEILEMEDEDGVADEA